MPEKNVAAVRRIYGEWGRGNFREGVELYDPDIVLVVTREFPESGTYVGVDGVRRYMTTFLDAWERLTLEAQELIEAGDSVVANVLQRAVGKGSGAEPAEIDYFQIWTFRGGLVIRLDTIRERDSALRAAGLTPG